MQQLLEQRLQQAQPSSLDVMLSAHDAVITADECDPRSAQRGSRLQRTIYFRT